MEETYFKVDFYYGNSFAGINYYMRLFNSKNLGLGLGVTEEQAKEKAIEYIRLAYNFELNPDDINFQWDGTL